MYANKVNEWLAKPWRSFIAFLLLITVLSLVFGYADLLHRPPMGLHQWRQTDCTSLAANYAKHGMHFFEPQIHHVIGGEGKAVAEFPVIYFFVALLYKVFGQHDFIFRLIDFLFLCAGLWSLFKMATFSLGDRLLGLLFTGFIFSSSVLAFYSISFVPDGPAFACAMIGWGMFFHFSQSGRMRHLNISLAAFTFAGLLKATTFMSVVVIGLLFLAEWLLKLRIKKEGKVFNQPAWKVLAAGLGAFLLMGIWYYWAIQYNKAHSSIYFSTRMWPFWEMETAEIKETFDLMFNYWGNDYFWRKSWPLIALISLVPLVFVRKVPRLLGLVALGMLAGGLVFMSAWFFAFKDHDYYFIQVIPALIFFMLAGLATLRNRFPNLRNSLLPALVMLVLVGFSARNTHKQYQKRFFPGGAHYTTVNEALFGAATRLDSLGISREAKLICLPDYTPNASLYFLDRPGWTELYHEDYQPEYTQQFINAGADYLVISRASWLTHPGVQPFTQHPIDHWDEITVFDVREYRQGEL